MPSEVQIITRESGCNLTTLILPGLNQDGAELIPVLKPGLEGSNVVTYRLPRSGFHQQYVVETLSYELNRRRGRYIVYAEGAGALDLAQILRRCPWLSLRQLILNAGMGSWEDANIGYLLQLSRVIPSGLVPTSLVRRLERRAAAHRPTLDEGVNRAAAERAEAGSGNVTGRQVMGELRRMVETPPVTPGEFHARARVLTYLGAPAPNPEEELAERDPCVHLRQGCLRWAQALALKANVVAPPNWAALHTPTPERPGPVISALQGAIAAA